MYSVNLSKYHGPLGGITPGPKAVANIWSAYCRRGKPVGVIQHDVGEVGEVGENGQAEPHSPNTLAPIRLFTDTSVPDYYAQQCYMLLLIARSDR